MNKVILMGRLTRDAEIRYSQGESSSVIARFTLAVGSTGTMRIRQRISLVVLHLVKLQSFWRSLERRVLNSPLKAASRLAAILIKTDSAFTLQMLWLKTWSLQKVKTPVAALPVAMLLPHRHRRRMMIHLPEAETVS